MKLKEKEQSIKDNTLFRIPIQMMDKGKASKFANVQVKESDSLNDVKQKVEEKIISLLFDGGIEKCAE